MRQGKPWPAAWGFLHKDIDAVAAANRDDHGFDDSAPVARGTNACASLRLTVLSLVDGSVLRESPTFDGSKKRAPGRNTVLVGSSKGCRVLEVTPGGPFRGGFEGP